MMPAAFSPDQEPVEFLRKYKTARVGKWRLTSSRTLWDAFDLACYYWALGRLEDAKAVCLWTSQMVFQQDYFIWSPVALQRALLSHLSSHAGDEDAASEWMSALRQHPGRAYGHDYVRDSVNRDLEETEQSLHLVEGGIASFGEARSRTLLALRRTLGLLQDHKWGILTADWLAAETLQDYQARALKMLSLAVEPKSYAAHAKAAAKKQSAGGVLSAEGEPNPHLRKFKAKREGQWDFQNLSLLQDAGVLAAYLYALGREEEVVQLGKLILDGGGHHDALRVAAFVHAQAGRLDQAQACFQPVLDVPSGGWLHPTTPERAEDRGNYWHRIERYLGVISAGSIRESAASRRQGLADTLCNAQDLWLRGTLIPDSFGWYPLPLLAGQVERAAKMLREALE